MHLNVITAWNNPILASYLGKSKAIKGVVCSMKGAAFMMSLAAYPSTGYSFLKLVLMQLLHTVEA